MASPYREILRVTAALDGEGIPHLLVGGFAVNHHGYTRNTADMDFMIAATQTDPALRLMKAAGYTNVSVMDNVAFVQKPGEQLRIDFLRADEQTMEKLLGCAVEATFYGVTVKVPALHDLIAMKLFALHYARARRAPKDLPDVVYLTVLNDLDLDLDIRPLCRRYASDELYTDICREVERVRRELR